MAAAGIVLATTIAACGGGGGGSATPTPAPTPGSFSISGTILPAPDSAIDSDTNDRNATRRSNDDPANAQAINSLTTVGGYVTSAGDINDVFTVMLARDQVVILNVAEDGLNNDLDLGLLDAAGNLVESSVSTTNREALVVPDDGNYFIVVQAFDGASNYMLSIAAPGTPSALMHSMHTGAEILPGELLVQLDTDTALAKRAGDRLQESGLDELPGIPGIAQRYTLGAPTQWNTTLAKLGHSTQSLSFASQRIAERHETLIAIKRVARMSGVLHAEPNRLLRALATPNDRFFNSQWHYRLINLPAAWEMTQGSPNVLVAVLDTGVVLSHPDLAGKLADGFDFVSSASQGLDGNGIDSNADDPGDEPGGPGGSSFHGTHVSGTIAAATGNADGVAGAGWNTRVMPVRVLGARGAGSGSDILNGLRYAAGLSNASGQLPTQRADVINLSLGCTECFSQIEQDVYRSVVAAGVIVIAAAGNDGTSERSFPASYDGVVSVGSVGPAIGGPAQRAAYSQFNADVDVAAPGGDLQRFGTADGGILSTHASDTGGSRVAIYGYLHGTSMATPHVAGVAALMKAVNPALTPQQFDQLLASGTITQDLGAAGRDNQFGHGLIDAAAAVRAAMSAGGGTPPPDAPQLTVQPEMLSFAQQTSSRSLEARNVGTGSLSIQQVVVDVPWLSVTLEQTTAGRFVYTARVDRTGLADGTYSGSIRFESNAPLVTVPVMLSVGGTVQQANAGLHYVLLLDSEDLEVVDQQIATASNGSYSYRFEGIPAGTYLIIAGTDNDEDLGICDGGEACGGYTTLDEPVTVMVGPANASGIDFSTGFAPATVARGTDGTALAKQQSARTFRPRARPDPRQVQTIIPSSPD